MRRILVHVKTQKVGSMVEDIFEVDDIAPPDLINELAKEAMFEMIEWDWKEVK